LNIAACGNFCVLFFVFAIRGYDRVPIILKSRGATITIVPSGLGTHRRCFYALHKESFQLVLAVFMGVGM
jgi:hypothetical protein